MKGGEVGTDRALVGGVGSANQTSTSRGRHTDDPATQHSAGSADCSIRRSNATWSEAVLAPPNRALTLRRSLRGLHQRLRALTGITEQNALSRRT
jgi:hypothetical protein